MQTHIIYIPGLGDGYDPFRRLSLKGWRLWGVSTELVPITWYDGGSFEQKYSLVSEAIERSSKSGRRIVLIGESAGGSLVLHAAKNAASVDRVITLCGVATNTTPISAYLRRKAPALDTAVNGIEDTNHPDVHSVRAAVDGVVGKRYSIAEGATPHIIWSVGHLTTIVLCLTILSPLMVKIAKSNKK